MKTLITIWCHREVSDTVWRHMTYWVAHSSDILFVCPNNSVLDTTWPVLAMEPSKHNGVEINRKFRRMLEFWLKMAYDRFLFFEYDAICFAPDIPVLDPCKLYGNLFTSDQKAFQGHYFLHPPIMVHRPTLSRLVDFARTVHDETDRFWDRLLGYYCEFGKIPFGGYEGLGFARNTIEQKDIPEAVAARKAGAVFFHGIKSNSVLNALVAV